MYIHYLLLYFTQRVNYDKSTNNAIKNNKIVHFPKKLYMDRYLSCNQLESTKRRVIMKKLKSEKLALELELSGLINYENQGVSLNVALKGIFIHCIIIIISASSIFYSTINATISSDLNRASQLIESNINSLKDKIKSKEAEIEAVFSDMKNLEYHLRSVLVHGGSANEGHYWCYICMPGTNEWFKYSDIEVTPVTWDQVYSFSVGGGSSSAYFFVYSLENLPVVSNFCYLTKNQLINERVRYPPQKLLEINDPIIAFADKGLIEKIETENNNILNRSYNWIQAKMQDDFDKKVLYSINYNIDLVISFFKRI